MFKKGMFDDCPTVLARLRQDVPRPKTLPRCWRSGGGFLRWRIGQLYYCPMGLHPEATTYIPKYGIGAQGCVAEFPAPQDEVCKFLSVWDALNNPDAETATDEIWPPERRKENV